MSIEKSKRIIVFYTKGLLFFNVVYYKRIDK